MDIAAHLLLFFFSISILWFFAGQLIEAVEAVAKRFNRSGFTVAFFILGFLTSIGEISVMVNASIDGTPQISAGNVIGASLVILLFIVPTLAIVGRGMHMENTLTKKQFAVALFVALLPVLFVLDGNVHMNEGILCLIAYVSLFYLIQKPSVRWWWKKRPNSAPAVISKVEEELTGTRKKTLVDALTIGGGALMIFLAGNLLVEESIYFSELFGVPGSIIGLLVLSVGTNVPELVIAIRAIRKKSMDIAFGDYLGSVVANAVIFGLLALLNGGFSIEPSSFYFTAGIMVLGFIALFLFSVTKDTLSRREGLILVWLYSVFLVSQFVNVAWLLSH